MKVGRKMKSKVKIPQLATVAALTAALVLPIPFMGSASATSWVESGTLDKNGMFQNNYANLEEALAAAREKHEEVVDEGTALLKNNGLLPLNVKSRGSNKITVFNSCQGLTEGLKGVGFKVNELSVSSTTTLAQEGAQYKVVNNKAQGNSGLVNETTLTDVQRRSMKEYNDVAVVRIFRVAGEANEVSTGRSALGGSGFNVDPTQLHVEDWGDITWIDSTGKIVDYDQAKYEAGELREAWPDGTPKLYQHKHLTPNDPLARWSTSKNLADRDLEPVRHGLMLTQYEEKMIQTAKANFDHVVIVYDSITQFELYDLEHDDGIDAIIHSGRMTNTNANNPSLWAGRGVARVMCGEVNPSASLVSQWDVDMTADPTWQNFGDNFQMDSSSLYTYSDGTPTGAHTRGAIGGIEGLHGIDYEEGIYLGYKYYETYWWETVMGNTEVSVNQTAMSSENLAAANAWHDVTVNYPFGYGLSYTNFDYEIVGVEMAGDKGGAVENGSTIAGSKFASTASKAADVETLNVKVKVTNIGRVGGKATVQLYASAPYVENGVEVPFVKLVGFDKTISLNPNQSETVTIPVQMQDIASFDYDGRSIQGYTGYVLNQGEYSLFAMNSSSVYRATNGTIGTEGFDDAKKNGLSYDAFGFTLENEGAVALAQDDFSGNTVEAIFSTENTREYTIRDESIMAEGGTGMTILSRGDLDGTFPKAPTYKDLRLDDNYIDDFVRSELSFVAGYQRERSDSGLTTAKTEYSVPAAGADVWYYDAEKGKYDYRDDEGDAWYITQAAFDAAANRTDTGAVKWTQAAQSVRDADTTGAGATVKLREMAGEPLYVDGKINPKWDAFMNQLTYLEMQHIASAGQSSLVRIDSIDKNQSAARDNTSYIDGIYHWGDQPLLSRTWNLDLCADHGAITAQYAAHGGNSPTGWWSPGCNIHRSPFSGRNGDYYGQDAFQAGMVIAAVTDAAEEYGLACWIKHFVLNDQETNRNGYSLFTWGDEQTFRENYFMLPQKAFQEGRAKGNMQSFARIGGCVFANSYEANTKLVRDQWGWTGISVTDAYAGMKGLKYNVPETPTWWFDAATTIDANGNATAYDKTKALDTTKNWVENRTSTLDQLVRGTNGLPDATNTRGIKFVDGEYVYAINTYDDEAGKFNSYANTKTPHTTTKINLVNSNPVSGVWVETMNGGQGGVYLEYEDSTTKQTTMTDSARNQWYYVRLTSMLCCYEAANSRGNQNGMLVNDNTSQLRNYHGTKLDVEGLKQGAAAEEISVAITDPTSFTFGTGANAVTYKNTVVYSVVGGKLPAGLKLDADKGVITGTPTETTATDTVVTIECRVANYLYGNKTVTFKPIASAVTLGTVTGKVGTAYEGALACSVEGDATYTVEGLPVGLSYADGKITGTPNYAGKYTIKVTATVGKAKYTSDVVLDVAGLTAEDIIAATTDKLTEAQVKAIVDAAAKDHLTEAQVKKLIDDALAANAEEGGCGSAIGFGSFAAILSAMIVAFVAVVAVRKAKSKKE